MHKFSEYVSLYQEALNIFETMCGGLADLAVNGVQVNAHAHWIFRKHSLTGRVLLFLLWNNNNKKKWIGEQRNVVGQSGGGRSIYRNRDFVQNNVLTHTWTPKRTVSLGSLVITAEIVVTRKWNCQLQKRVQYGRNRNEWKRSNRQHDSKKKTEGQTLKKLKSKPMPKNDGLKI